MALLRLLLVAYFVLPPSGHLRAQAPINLQLPFERATNSFTIQEKNGAGVISTPISPGGIANVVVDENGVETPTAQSYLRGAAPAPANDYFIRDESTGDMSPPNLVGTPSFDRTSFLTTHWYGPWQAAPSFFVALPANRSDHLLSIVTSGATYPLTNGPQLAYETVDGSGQPILAYYAFFDASASTSPSGAYFILDSSTHEQSSIHAATQHDFVSNETWTSFTGAVPTRLLTISLDDSEGTATFILHTTEGSAAWLTPQWQWDANASRYAFQVSTTLGVNQQFWLERQQDGRATALEWLGITDLSMDATTAFPSYFTPVTVTFEVGENHWNNPIVVDQGNGTTVTAQPDMTSLGYTNLVDYLGRVYYSFGHVTFTAAINPSQTYTPRDASTGGTALMDGFNPPNPPSPQPQTVVISVGENHWSDVIYLSQPDGSFIWPTVGYGGAETANDSLGNPYYSYAFYNYSFTIDSNQAYSVVDSTGATSFMDGFNPPYNAFDPADLSSLTLQIAADRWSDNLEIHTSYGDVWPVQADQMQGFWTTDQTSQSWFTSYYAFTATGQARVGFDWWVYDVTQGNSSPANTHDLSGWAGDFATTDSDGDGLFDWYELLLHLNPFDPDTDHDGLPDGWELAHGFDPRDPSDGAVDPDHDGLSNAAEYWYGTNPHSSDSDGDGIPDGWEVAHGLNPLVNDANDDPDGDGISNFNEYLAGTNPGSADTDGDGRSDSWELANGGNPTVGGTWVTVQLSAGRLGHHLTLWRNGVAEEFHPALTLAGTAEALVELFGGPNRITDDTAGDEYPLSGDNAGHWTSAAYGSSPEYLLLPQTIQQDVLILCIMPQWYAPWTTPAAIAQVTTSSFAVFDPQGGMMCVGRTTFVPYMDNWVVNLSTGQKAPAANITDLAHLSWQPNDILLPLVNVNVRLRADDNGRAFSVSSSGYHSQFITAARTEGDALYPVLHVSAVAGMPLRVTRSDDGATVESEPVSNNVSDFDCSTAFAADSQSAQASNLTVISFKVGIEHQGINGFTDSGAPISVWPDGTGGGVDFWDASGQTHTYEYQNYVAYVDPNQGYHFQDSSGAIDFWDAGPWVPHPTAASLVLALSGDRRHDNIVLVDAAQNRWPVRIQPGYADADYYYTASETIYAGQADHAVQLMSYSYVPAVSDFDGSSSFTVLDMTNGDYIPFAAASGRNMVDLSQWLKTMPVDLTISATRSGHALEIHTFDGRSYPVGSAMFISPWMPNMPVSIATAALTWSFNTSGTALSDGGAWWVYDRTTDEVAAGYAQDLTSWASADADLDSDSDGLPDWFERVVNLDPQNPDSDGDGLTDGFEVKYRLNPFFPQIDTDGDGLSDIWEIARGLDPLDPNDAVVSRHGNGVSNLDEFKAVFGNQLPTNNVDSDGDGIPDDIEIQNGTDPFQSDSLDSDGDGVPDYRDAWPFDPHLQGSPLPVPHYALIEIHQLAANEQLDKLLLGEGGQVAYQLSNRAQPLAPPTAFYWSGSGSPSVQAMYDPSDPEPTEGRGFYGIISITEGGSVFGRWTKDTGDEVNGCGGFPTHRLYYPSALWSPGSMAYLGPLPVPDPFFVYGDQPATRFIPRPDYFLVDRYGSEWSTFTESGTMGKRDLSDLRHCEDHPELTFFGTKLLAQGDFNDLRYKGQSVVPTGLGLGSSADLHYAFENFHPDANASTVTLTGGDELTFLTANDLGGFLATVTTPPGSPTDRLILSDMAAGGSRSATELTSQFPSSPSSIVALSNDDVVLTQHYLVAKSAAGKYETVSPRGYSMNTGGVITWVDFNAHHTAVGQAGSGAVILVNDTVYDLATLCGGDSTLGFGFAGGPPMPQVINDAGWIVAVANTSPDGTIVLLVPVEIVRETQSGNGDYKPLAGGGFTKESALPVYASELGEGSAVAATFNGASLRVHFSTNLNSAAIGTLEITYSGGASTYNATLTETGGGTGLYQTSSHDAELMVASPNRGATDLGSKLSVQLTIPSLGMYSKTFELINSDSLSFRGADMMTDIIVSSLSTTAPNTVTAVFDDGNTGGNTHFSVILNETGENTRVFQDSPLTTTVIVSGLSQSEPVSQMEISVSSTGLPHPFSTSLKETGAGTLQFSNYTFTSSEAVYNTPATDGQGVFYVQLPGSTAIDLTLTSGSDEITVSATPVPNEPNMLRTGKLALVAANDPFSDADIKTLKIAQDANAQSSNPEVTVKVTGQEVGKVQTVKPAFVGWGHISDEGGGGPLEDIRAALVNKLGWTAPTVRAKADKAGILEALPRHSLFYMGTHGLVPNFGEGKRRFVAFAAYKSTDPKDHAQADVTPAEVKTNNGKNVYDLVFLNACNSADMTDKGSQAEAMANAFNARAYVGYDASQWTLQDRHMAQAFFNALKDHSDVKSAIAKANSFYRGPVALLKTLRDDGVIVDKTPIAK